jgi:glycosyltransferase involved in cell wall biosynthesis
MKLVIQSGSRIWGGVEKWLAMVAVGLRSRGHDVVVSCHARGPVRRRLEELGVPTSHTRPRGALDVVSAGRFAWWLRRERPDAVLLTVWRRLFWGAWAGRRAGCRVIVRLGLFEPPPRRHPNHLAFRRWIDKVIANSEDIRADVAAALPWFGTHRVHVIFNGVTPRAPLTGEERARLREELGGDGDASVFAAAGHAFPRKGFDILLRAMAHAGRRDVRLAIIGDGPQIPELRALAASLGITAQVRFLGHRPDAAALIAAADAFVLSSRHEGMANVMLEAMAAGRPVLATDVSGVREAIGAHHGRPPAGWIVPPEDPAAMGVAIAALAAHLAAGDDVVGERTAEAVWRVAQWFDIERMLDAVEAVVFGLETADTGSPGSTGANFVRYEQPAGGPHLQGQVETEWN